jgi:mannose-1-phosphate guanylyltransferase/mannose-6-phosphate isomerase
MMRVTRMARKVETPMTSTYSVGERDSRPWGTWEVVATGDGHVVKRITVVPGARLSLQRHRHRSEHWVMVTGSAHVTVDERTFPCTTGEHVHIPCGAVHRIANPGTEPLVFIEVQQGALLDEDDIERLEDDFGRIPGGV